MEYDDSYITIGLAVLILLLYVLALSLLCSVRRKNPYDRFYNLLGSKSFWFDTVGLDLVVISLILTIEFIIFINLDNSPPPLTKFLWMVSIALLSFLRQLFFSRIGALIPPDDNVDEDKKKNGKQSRKKSSISSQKESKQAALDRGRNLELIDKISPSIDKVYTYYKSLSKSNRELFIWNALEYSFAGEPYEQTLLKFENILKKLKKAQKSKRRSIRQEVIIRGLIRDTLFRSGKLYLDSLELN